MVDFLRSYPRSATGDPPTQGEIGGPRCRYRASDLRMRIRVREAADVGGLIAFLREREYVAEQVGPNTVEVSRPSSVRHDHIRVELEVFLEAWHAARPGAHAELVE